MLKSYRFIYYIGLFFVVIGLLISCNSRSNQRELEQAIESGSDSFEETHEGSNMVYKIPTPLELFLFLQESEADYMSDALHHPLKYRDYYDSYSRALNFGIYTADLAYATVYGNNQDALLYFRSAKELAIVLGLNEGYGNDIANRIDDNLQNIDSLIYIAADSYALSVQYLEDQGSIDMLCLILSGGWVEALYLSTHSVPVYDINSPIIERIVDQQLLLDNLLLYLEPYQESENVARVSLQLMELQEEFDVLYANDENTLLTKQQFVNISNKVSEVRSIFVSGN